MSLSENGKDLVRLTIYTKTAGSFCLILPLTDAEHGVSDWNALHSDEDGILTISGIINDADGNKRSIFIKNRELVVLDMSDLNKQ